MKTKSIFFSFLSLCLCFIFSATPAQAADWAGYDKVFENRKIALYAKIDNYMAGYGSKQQHTRIDWRVVNHTDNYIRIDFTARYDRKSGKQASGRVSSYGRIIKPGEDAGYVSRNELYGDHVSRISGIFELKVKEGKSIQDLN